MKAMPGYGRHMLVVLNNIQTVIIHKRGSISLEDLEFGYKDFLGIPAPPTHKTILLPSVSAFKSAVVSCVTAWS